MLDVLVFQFCDIALSIGFDICSDHINRMPSGPFQVLLVLLTGSFSLKSLVRYLAIGSIMSRLPALPADPLGPIRVVSGA